MRGDFVDWTVRYFRGSLLLSLYTYWKLSSLIGVLQYFLLIFNAFLVFVLSFLTTTLSELQVFST